MLKLCFGEDASMNLAVLVEINFWTFAILQTPFLEQSMVLIIKRGSVLNELRMNCSVSPRRNRLYAICL